MNLPLFASHNRLRELFPDQKEALRKLDAARLDGHRRIMFEAATGFGKTLTAAHLIAAYVAAGLTVCFTVPRLSLIDKTVVDFGREGLQFGVVQGDHFLTDHTQPLQIASVQTLERRKGLPRFDVYVFDEAHIVHKVMIRLMRENPKALFLGLSATPWSKGLGKLYPKLVVACRTAELIAMGRLSKFVVYAPTPEPNLEGVKTTAGDYNQAQLAEAVNTKQLVGDIVSTWLKLGENLQTIAFCVDRAHAKHVQERFVEAGIACEYLDCFTSDLDRRAIIDRFHRGETKIIANVGVLVVGFDSDVRCIIDAHPTRSEMVYCQSIGRGLRTAPGKENCIILDHAGNALRLGLATDIWYDELDDGEKDNRAKKAREKREPLPRLCTECAAVIPQHVDVCPQCGARKHAKTEVIARDGELVRFGSGESGRPIVTIDEKAKFYAEVKGYWAEENAKRMARGKEPLKPGWPATQFKNKYGHWPNADRLATAMPKPSSLQTRNWLRSRAIAFAKARQAYG
ncbi:DEAD/DEAH box helicase [Methylocystis sp. IM3]|uniref:DEAD/DEAH box helicase n=1 Tax=unclassified Methylocystis TaxID=2625913 RepID=UPI0030FCB5E3